MQSIEAQSQEEEENLLMHRMQSAEAKGAKYRSATVSSINYVKCNRSFPCSNCIVRNKQSACHYENKPAIQQQLLKESANTSSDDEGSFGVIKLGSESIAQVSAFGFAKPNGSNNTTLGIFRKIWSHDADICSSLSKFTMTAIDNSGIREKYRNLIRQLPSKQIVENLVEIFFQEVNHQYYSLDEASSLII